MVNIAYRCAARVLHRVPLPSGKLATSIAGRRQAALRWREWAAKHRTDEPLVWVHAASVGESLSADPVLRRLKQAHPEFQIVHTYSSPSVAEWPGELCADRSDYVPLDEPSVTARTLDALKPALMVYSRGDIWPELTVQAADRAVPIAVIAGEVREDSRRLSWRSSRVIRRPLERVNWLGAVSEVDAGRWKTMGVAEDSISIAGDTRHDQVIERISCLAPLARLMDGGPTLVAGSTDSRDTEVLLDAFPELLRHIPSLRLLMAPHSLDQHSVQRTLTQARKLGIAAGEWQVDDEAPRSNLVIVTSYGLLADLYSLADVAYVGGGFRKKGLHTVLEPAAFGVPVIVGPEYRHYRDAEMLVSAGGAASLPRKSPTRPLLEQLKNWLANSSQRTAAGLAARGTLEQGAAKTTARALLALIK